MESSDNNIKERIKIEILNFNKQYSIMKSQASCVFSLEQGISSVKPDSNFPCLSFTEEEKKNNKNEMISKLQFIFENYPKLISYLEKLNGILTSNVKNKDPYYYGLLNDIDEYICKLSNICFDCQRIDKFYNLNVSKNLPDIKNYTYKEYVIEFKYMSDISIDFNLKLLGYKSKNEENNYDTNIDVKELKSKCGKTISNNYDTISNGYTMVTRSFEINKKLREDGIDSLNKSVRNVIEALSNTCMMNPCYKNMILFRYVDQNFIKNLFGIEFLNNSESSISDAVCKIKNAWYQKQLEVRLEGGFISASYIYSKNVFQDRDVLLKLYVPKGTPIYATDNDEESEIVITCGIIYIFFDAYYEKIKRFNGYFYRLIIKAFIKPTPFRLTKNVKNPPPIIVLNFNS